MSVVPKNISKHSPKQDAEAEVQAPTHSNDIWFVIKTKVCKLLFL